MNASAYDPAFYERSYATPGERYHEAYAKGLPEWASAMNAWAVDFVIALVGLDPQRDRILDLGSGIGHFVAQWQRRGFEVTGVEISPSAVRLAGNEAIVLGDIRDLSRFADKQFGFAMSVAVLEHLPLADCRAVMAGLARCARAHGHVIGHDAGGDPSHINIMSPLTWCRWFADVSLADGMRSVVAANVLAPTMPYFLGFDEFPAAVHHALDAYDSSLLRRLA